MGKHVNAAGAINETIHGAIKRLFYEGCFYVKSGSGRTQ